MTSAWSVIYTDHIDANNASEIINGQYPFTVNPLWPGDNMLIITDVPRGYQKEDIQNIFGQYGHIIKIEPITFPESSLSKFAQNNNNEYIVDMNYPYDMFNQLWPSGIFSDITLYVGNREFKVHRSVLSSVSPYFTHLFTKMRESNESTIKLISISPEIFEKLLQLIYTSRLPIVDLSILKVLQLIQYFQIKYIDIVEAISKIPYNVVGIENFYEYIMGLNQLYPEGFTSDIIELIKTHVNPHTDISFLSLELQSHLR